MRDDDLGLQGEIARKMHGQVAISNAKVAYQIYRVRSSSRLPRRRLL
jgi:hypothetical protein